MKYGSKPRQKFGALRRSKRHSDCGLEARYQSLVEGWRLEQEMGSEKYWPWAVERERIASRSNVPMEYLRDRSAK